MQVTAEQKKKKRIHYLLMALFLFALAEGAAWIAFARLPYLEKTRLMARGEAPPQPTFQTMIGQANLSYISAPKFENEFGPQHNAQGYRGSAVPMRRTPGVLRVLFLGGSTVYGWGVDRWQDSYPAQAEKLLNENLPPGIRGVEVINGGLPYGTTAEMLTHYHFKYHYFKPDVVVIEAGGNEGEAMTWPYYHPDYSHWRQQIQLPQRPPRITSFLMRSRLLSLGIIPAFYGFNFLKNNLQRPKEAPIAPWYEPASEQVRPPSDIPEDEMAMRHDLESLIAEIQRDGAQILLVPFRPAPGFVYQGEYLNEAIALNEKILNKIAKEKNLPLAPYPGDVIVKGIWLDDCHLNAEGEKEKAQHVVPFIRPLLFSKKVDVEAPAS